MITIKGRIPSKKNSVMTMCRNNRALHFPSNKYREWHKEASQQLIGVPKIPNNMPLIYCFYAPDNRKSDLSNKLESVNDLLVDCGILEDDNWFVLSEYRVRFMGVDKENPRVEILLTDELDTF